MKNIAIFTGPGCQHCEQAKALLKTQDIQYRERSVSEPEILAELRSRLPRARALPQIFVDEQHLGGLEDLRLWLESSRVRADL